MTALCRWSSAFEGHRNARDEHDRLRDISRGQSMRWGAFEFAWLRTSRNLVRLLLVLLIGGYRSTPRRLRPNNSAFVPEWKTRYANWAATLA